MEEYIGMDKINGNWSLCILLLEVDDASPSLSEILSCVEILNLKNLDPKRKKNKEYISKTKHKK